MSRGLANAGVYFCDFSWCDSFQNSQGFLRLLCVVLNYSGTLEEFWQAHPLGFGRNPWRVVSVYGYFRGVGVSAVFGQAGTGLVQGQSEYRRPRSQLHIRVYPVPWIISPGLAYHSLPSVPSVEVDGVQQDLVCHPWRAYQWRGHFLFDSRCWVVHCPGRINSIGWCVVGDHLWFDTIPEVP